MFIICVDHLLNALAPRATLLACASTGQCALASARAVRGAGSALIRWNIDLSIGRRWLAGGERGGGVGGMGDRGGGSRIGGEVWGVYCRRYYMGMEKFSMAQSRHLCFIFLSASQTCDREGLRNINDISLILYTSTNASTPEPSPRFPNPSSPNSLRIPKHHLRIIHLLQRQQPRIHRIAIIQLMRLRGRVARIHIIQIRSEGRLRLGIRNSVVEARHERLDGGREGGAGVAGEAVVLEDPEGGAVRVSGGGGVLGVDL